MSLFTRGLSDATRQHKAKRKWVCQVCGKQSTRVRVIDSITTVICANCELARRLRIDH